jgi:large subunit ribosomal protein L9
MEVILLQDMDKLGARGQIVKVADGYARNYLLPQKHALKATPQNRKWLEQQRVRFLKMEASEKTDAAELAKLLEGVNVLVTRKAGDQGTLFGSVTSQDIAEKLAGQGYRIDRRKIQLDHPLKVLGEYDIRVRLHRDVTATVRVKVEAEGALEHEGPPVAETTEPESSTPESPAPPATTEPAAE